MVKSLIALLILAAVFGFACAAIGATDTLTLSLETPSLGNTAAADKPQPSSNTPQPKTESKTDQTVEIGHVGIVQVVSASIRQSRSNSSRLFAVVKAQTPLAIVNEVGDWYGVLMINGATGWIPRKCVKLVGYNLVAKKSDVQRSSLASRGEPTSRTGLADADIIRTAMQYAGVPYVYGGTSPTSGMDCSAFVRSVFNQYGVHLPRTAREQAQVGENVSFDQLQPGDRLYFACKNPYPDHCGIYAGNGYFIHCSSRRKGVGVDSLMNGFYNRALVAARRS